MGERLDERLENAFLPVNGSDIATVNCLANRTVPREDEGDSHLTYRFHLYG